MSQTKEMLREMIADGNSWAKTMLAEIESEERTALLGPERLTGLAASIARQKRRDAAKKEAVDGAREVKRVRAARRLEAAFQRVARVRSPLIVIVPSAHLERAALNLRWVRGQETVHAA